jgi:hypothetical protein
MKLIKDRISKPNKVLSVTYKNGYEPKPLQPIDESMIEKTTTKTVYSYNGTSKLFDVICTSDGKKTYAINSRVSDKTPTHKALEAYFNI